MEVETVAYIYRVVGLLSNAKRLVMPRSANRDTKHWARSFPAVLNPVPDSSPSLFLFFSPCLIKMILAA